jgi:hypothetical protein
MDHAMTVCADKSEILQPCLAAAYDVEWHHVVALDVPSPTFSVHLLEVKAAYLAGDGLPVASYGFDLSLPKPSRSLARDVEPYQQGALDGPIAFFVNWAV